MKKRVLLTGATGFIGRQAIESLLAKGYEVHAVSKMALETLPDSVHKHQCDLIDHSQTTALMQQIAPTHLLHFAWYAIPGKYWTSSANLDWVRASLHLVQQFASAGGKRMMLAGTCAEYDWSSGLCVEGATPLTPLTLYGSCKAGLYRIVESFAKQNGLSSAWGRIFFLYGPHEYPERLVPSVIRSLLKNETAKCSHGTQIRDFMHVADVADAFVTLLDSDLQGSINIASGEPLPLKTVIEKIAHKCGKTGQVQYGPLTTSPNDPPLISADVSRLQNELRWRPRYSLDQGLEETINWWKKHL